jgi:hypothetical protein
MNLVNQTPVPAKLVVSSMDDGPQRFGILSAKATFALVPGNRAELVSQDPYPLFDKDQKTEFGLLPADMIPRRDRVFEVIVLGAAYGWNNKDLPSRVVELAVGDVTRRLAVFGDRTWESTLMGKRIPAPKPFQKMPLTYDRAFGGFRPAKFDEHTIFDVEDRINKHGKGFDAEKMAQDLAAGFKAPGGFPVLDVTRPMPNLEHPDHLIAKWEDAPEPYCWATVPDDIGFRSIRLIRKFRDTRQPPTRDEAVDQAYHRAHPDWIIPLPPPGARVTLMGMTADHPLTFTLPPLRLQADYVLGSRTGTRDLAPHLLMLLPEARRFYIVYRTAFTMEVRPDMERSFRLRLGQGWFQYPVAAGAAAKGR